MVARSEAGGKQESSKRGKGRIKQPQSKEGRQSRGTMDERAAERKEGKGERAACAKEPEGRGGGGKRKHGATKGASTKKSGGGGKRSRVVGPKSGEREKQHGDTRVHAH